MSLTRIQPSGLDASLNYSVNTLSANTILDGGVEIIAVANGAFDQANAAFAAANAAGSSATVTAAFNTANSAGLFANAAFAAANAAGSSATVTAAFSTANSATTLATAAFAKANTPSGITYTAANTTPVGPKIGDQWFNVNKSILFEYISDGISNTWIDVSSDSLYSGDISQGTQAFDQANAAFAAANAAGSSATTTAAFNTANSAGLFANAAFAAANAAGSSATVTAAFNTANAAFAKANTGASAANTFVNVNFPLGDFGFVAGSYTTALGESNLIRWDNATTIQPPSYASTNGLTVLDAGSLT